MTYNDDGGEDNNFYYTYNLTAGNVYYISARYYDSSSNGNFSINVSMPNNTSTLVAVSK